MNCKFCNNIVYPDLDRSPHETQMNTGWCHKCPTPIYYEWELQLPGNDEIKYRSIAVCHPSRFDDNSRKYYYFLLNYLENYTELIYYNADSRPMTEIIVLVPGILDITPNNFFRKLKTYITFS